MNLLDHPEKVLRRRLADLEHVVVDDHPLGHQGAGVLRLQHLGEVRRVLGPPEGDLGCLCVKCYEKRKRSIEKSSFFSLVST